MTNWANEWLCSLKLPAAAYFFIEDAFHKTRVEIVAALTRIEAEQLPVNIYEPGSQKEKILGLTYSEKKQERKNILCCNGEKKICQVRIAEYRIRQTGEQHTGIEAGGRREKIEQTPE